MTKSSNGRYVSTGYALVYIQTVQKDSSLSLSDEPIAIIKAYPKTLADHLAPYKLASNQRHYLKPISMKDANKILEFKNTGTGTPFIEAYRKLKRIKGGYL